MSNLGSLGSWFQYANLCVVLDNTQLLETAVFLLGVITARDR